MTKALAIGALVLAMVFLITMAIIAIAPYIAILTIAALFIWYCGQDTKEDPEE